ncbi:MAG: hypothetical protein Q8Q94_02720 [bacterium]|nr:hypothetical protein [bacterium]
MATYLFIDGENFKGKVRAVFKDASKQRPVWHEYDFKGLLDKVLNGIAIDRQVFYFASIKEHAESMEKSKQLIEEQRLLKTHLERQGAGSGGRRQVDEEGIDFQREGCGCSDCRGYDGYRVR